MCEETEADGMIDCADAVVFGLTYYRAAKEHVCSSCCRTITKGQIYAYLLGGMDGDFFWNAKFCADCDHDRRWLNKRGHSWMVGIITSNYEACRLELAGS